MLYSKIKMIQNLLNEQSQNSVNKQTGNAFLIVMLGIVLFATLAFTISRSMRSDSTKRLSNHEAKLAATDILNYSQKIERAVNRLRRKNISENDLSFDQNIVAGYDHGQPNTNKIFNGNGGSLTWSSPMNGVNDGSQWHFTGSTCIADIGTGGTGCDSDADSNEELIAVLPNLQLVVCESINDRLGITSVPSDTGSGYSTAQFTGSFSDDTEIILADGPFNAACFEEDGSYHFYSLLLGR